MSAIVILAFFGSGVEPKVKNTSTCRSCSRATSSSKSALIRDMCNALELGLERRRSPLFDHRLRPCRSDKSRRSSDRWMSGPDGSRNLPDVREGSPDFVCITHRSVPSCFRPRGSDCSSSSSARVLVEVVAGIGRLVDGAQIESAMRFRCLTRAWRRDGQHASEAQPATLKFH